MTVNQDGLQIGGAFATLSLALASMLVLPAEVRATENCAPLADEWEIGQECASEWVGEVQQCYNCVEAGCEYLVEYLEYDPHEEQIPAEECFDTCYQWATAYCEQ